MEGYFIENIGKEVCLWDVSLHGSAFGLKNYLLSLSHELTWQNRTREYLIFLWEKVSKIKSRQGAWNCSS